VNSTRIASSAFVAAALIAVAVPAAAQQRGGEDARKKESGRAAVSAPAQRGGGGREQSSGRATGQRGGGGREQSSGRATATQRGGSGQQSGGGQGVARGSGSGQPSGGGQGMSRGSGGGPQSSGHPSAQRGSVGQQTPGGRNDGRAGFGQPQVGGRNSSRQYARPRDFEPYRPFSFSRPHYVFRERLNLGFGLWLGYSVAYPWSWYGNYRPRIYGRGFYHQGSYYYAEPGVWTYGGLSFDIQPPDADLYIDDEYVGTVGTFTPYGEPLTLLPGIHRIAIVRDGYRTLEWDVAVEAGQVLPYRGMMEPW
jgi:hypothetical protein